MTASGTLTNQEEKDIDKGRAEIDVITDKNVFHIICGYLDIKDYVYDTRYSFFRNLSLNINEKLERLIQDAIVGRNTGMVLSMFDENPELLLLPILIKGPDGSSPPERATFYQYLLWADDNYIRYHDKEGKTFQQEARDLLVKHFGKKEAETQRRGWFGNWNEKAHIKDLKSEFDKVIQAFDVAETADDASLLKAIETFTNYLATVQTRKNCIPLLWDYAATIYETRFHKYNQGTYLVELNSGSPKNMLFCHTVLNALDKHLPAWGLQVLLNGVHEVGYDFIVRDVSSAYAELQNSKKFIEAYVGRLALDLDIIGITRIIEQQPLFERFFHPNSVPKNKCSLM